MKQIPLLFWSDAPELTTGLARITRDLATHVVNDLPQFRVGTYGRCGAGSRRLPFAQYGFWPSPLDQWGYADLAKSWEDFAEGDPGIIFTIQDPSRMYAFTHPEGLPGDAPRFLCQASFKRFGYFPVDSTGPGDKLSSLPAAALQGYDRILGYTKFGAGVLSRSIGHPVDWIPHGLDMDVFRPRDRKAARIAMGFSERDLVMGCNMTNQPRKDWALWASIAAHLKRSHPNVKLWAHIDTLERAWSLPALIEDYGLAQNVKVTMAGTLTDEELSYFYSACNIVILPSLGEGWGYPISEALACGVPCIHGDYAGGAEMLPPEMRVPIQAWRVDTPYNCVRPVFDPAAWAERTMDVVAHAPYGGWSEEACRNQIRHCGWDKLWPSCWRKFFCAGLEDHQ